MDALCRLISIILLKIISTFWFWLAATGKTVNIALRLAMVNGLLWGHGHDLAYILCWLKNSIS